MQQFTESSATQPPRMKRCPMCDEEILMAARKCKHCQEYLAPAATTSAAQSSAGSRNHSKAIAVWFCVAVLLVIAGLLAFPFITQARIKANEDAVIRRLFQINKAEAQFFESEQRSGTLKELFSKGLISSPQDEQDGYHYYVSLHSAGIMFDATAKPVDYGSTGIRSFYTSGIFIHAADRHGGAATEDDPNI